MLWLPVFFNAPPYTTRISTRITSACNIYKDRKTRKLFRMFLQLGNIITNLTCVSKSTNAADPRQKQTMKTAHHSLARSTAAKRIRKARKNSIAWSKRAKLVGGRRRTVAGCVVASGRVPAKCYRCVRWPIGADAPATALRICQTRVATWKTGKNFSNGQSTVN